MAKRPPRPKPRAAAPIRKPQAIRAVRQRSPVPQPVPRIGAEPTVTVHRTALQTAALYDPRIDLKTDWAVVDGAGAAWEDIDRTVQSWRTAGYPVHRMFSTRSDAGSRYTGGKPDGALHADEVETDVTGARIAVGGRAAMLPTEGWLAFLKEHVRRAIDSGAQGVWPEEPELHAASGYSPAFKAAWQNAYQTPWEPPNSSPAAYFRASRLKADLTLRAVDELLRFTRASATERGRDVKFILPVQSPVACAESGLIFPHAAAARLPLDGIAAQFGTGAAGAPWTYEGRTESGHFENTWMAYAGQAGLTDGLPERPFLYLPAPVQESEGFTWEEYERRCRSLVCTSLMFLQSGGFGGAPWPERLYLPTQGAGQQTGATVAPVALRTRMSGLVSALTEMPAQIEWSGATRGVGVLTLDTMMWQRGGPQGSSLRSLHGLVLPLLKRGIPVELVPMERLPDRGVLSRFKVLLLSYDMQKPLGPELHQPLAAWVRAGGALVLMGGADAYNDVGEWWTRSGYPSPQEHLLRECGVAADLPHRVVTGAAARYVSAMEADGDFRALENRRTYRLPLTGRIPSGQTVYLRFSDSRPADGWGAWLGRVRVLQGGRLRADFVAGSAAERPFLAEETGSRAGQDHRSAGAEAAFVYRFRDLGPDAVFELEMGNQFRVSIAAGVDPSLSFRPLAPGFPALRAGSAYRAVGYPLSGAEPLYQTPEPPASPAWSSAAGSGVVLFCGLPAAFGADSAAGADLVRALVRQACARVSVPYTEGPIIARRGPYVVAHALDRTVDLKGAYIDLFKQDLPLVENPRLPYREPALFKQASLLTRIPTLLHGTHRVRLLETGAGRTRLLLDGPEETPGVLRFFPAGMSLAGIQALDPNGQVVDVDAAVEGRTLRIRYPQRAQGITLTLRWIRPEARLTK